MMKVQDLKARVTFETGGILTRILCEDNGRYRARNRIDDMERRFIAEAICMNCIIYSNLNVCSISS